MSVILKTSVEVFNDENFAFCFHILTAESKNFAPSWEAEATGDGLQIISPLKYLLMAAASCFYLPIGSGLQNTLHPKKFWRRPSIGRRPYKSPTDGGHRPPPRLATASKTFCLQKKKNSGGSGNRWRGNQNILRTKKPLRGCLKWLPPHKKVGHSANCYFAARRYYQLCLLPHIDFYQNR